MLHICTRAGRCWGCCCCGAGIREAKQKGKLLDLRRLGHFQLRSWGFSPTSPKTFIVESPFSKQEGNNQRLHREKTTLFFGTSTKQRFENKAEHCGSTTSILLVTRVPLPSPGTDLIHSIYCTVTKFSRQNSAWAYKTALRPDSDPQIALRLNPLPILAVEVQGGAQFSYITQQSTPRWVCKARRSSASWLKTTLSVAELLWINDNFARQNKLQVSQGGSAGLGAWQKHF